ncbi:hypothetical protein [Spiroplasma endosymbiont of Polydrusus formosus]|uniref:hypothetical protein n=1 Tax=Spiroplasma endosymbiont of Polydrusus formosus TaxID=3139326 RepID=UPI0035B549DA
MIISHQLLLIIITVHKIRLKLVIFLIDRAIVLLLKDGDSHHGFYDVGFGTNDYVNSTTN